MNMTDIEQKALELDLIARVIGAYHTTRLSGDAYEHVLRSPHVREAFDRLNAGASDADKSRYAAELREQAERFSEVVSDVLPWLEPGYSVSERQRAALRAFILPAADPLVEVLDEIDSASLRPNELAAALRKALADRDISIVAKDANHDR